MPPRTTMLLSSILAMTILASCGIAGDGFPPLGAWAYGYGSSYASVGRHFNRPRSLHYHRRIRPAGYPVVGLHGGWGVYGHRSFISTTRIAYTGFHPPYIAQPYWAYYPGYQFYLYRSPLFVPSYYAYDYCEPITPVTWGFPLGAGPGTSRTSSTWSFANESKNKHTEDYRHGTNQTLDWQPSDARNTSISTRLVTTEVGRQAALIPTELLKAADSIFAAGGFSAAATAYAQLSVRYGTHDQILGRRFIAQIASGDLEQASVILASAKLAGFNIDASHLPEGNLHAMFRNQPAALEMSTELLASYSLAQPDNPEAMEMIGLWLELAGDYERSSLFFNMAHRLSSETPIETLPPLDSMAEFVSLE